MKKQQFKTIGKNTYNIIAVKDQDGKLCLLAECYSQYGWEDGCRDRNPIYVKLSTLKCIHPNNGDAYYCGHALLEGEIVNIKDYSNRERLGYGIFEKDHKVTNIWLTIGEAEKVGLVKPCFPKGKVRRYNKDLAATGQQVYFPKSGSNKYYKAVTKWEPYMGYNARFEHYFFKGIVDGITVSSYYMKYEDANCYEKNKAVLFAK